MGSIIPQDIDAIREAVEALDGVEVTVTDIDTVDRGGDDERTRWSMTCEAETRTASLADFEPSQGDD